MLTGTLVTVAGFLPIATAKSGTGEYTRSIFQVSAIALDRVVGGRGGRDPLPRLPDAARLSTQPRRAVAVRRDCWARLHRAPAARGRARRTTAIPRPSTGRRSTRGCARSIDVVRRAPRSSSSSATLAVFAAALALFRFVPQQFFPSSSRPELLVDLRLPEGSSFAATLAAGEEAGGDPRRRSRASRATSRTSARAARASTCRSTSSCSSRTSRSSCWSRRATTSASGCARGCSSCSTTTSRSCAAACRGSRTARRSGFPVQFRVSGEDIATVRAHRAARCAAVMRARARTRQRAVRLGRAVEGRSAWSSTRTRRACSASRRRSSPRSSTTRCPGFSVT